MTKWGVTSEKTAEKEVPSSHPSTETSKNKQKLLKLTSLKLWKTKAYNNQTNAKSKKKGNLKVIGRICVIFTCSCHTPLHLSGNLKVDCSHSQYGEDSYVWPQEEKSELQHKLLCRSVLTCLGVTWRTSTRCSSLSPNMKLNSGQQYTLLKNIVSLINYPQSPGAKDNSWDIK